MKLNKKNVLLIGLLGSLILLVYIYIGGSYADACYSKNWCRDLEKISEPIVYTLIIFPILFLLSLITYKLRNEVFERWFKFARWYAPLWVVLAFFLSSNLGGPSGFGIGGAVNAWFINLLIFTPLALFLLISLILIVTKSFALRGKK